MNCPTLHTNPSPTTGTTTWAPALHGGQHPIDGALPPGRQSRGGLQRRTAEAPDVRLERRSVGSWWWDQSLRIHGAGIFTYIGNILNYFRVQCR